MLGQESETKFEVASVRPAKPAPGPQSGGNLTIRGFQGGRSTSPERINFPNTALQGIIAVAYGVRADRVSGPGWLASEKYDIAAKAPAGAKDEQVQVMLQNLLTERFKLVLHHEARIMSVYELTVGKNGSKLKVGAPIVPPDLDGPSFTVGEPDKDGFPQIPPGMPLTLVNWANGIMHWTYSSQPLSNLAYRLEIEMGRPVVDKTGMTGKYTFTFAYSGPNPIRPRAQAAPSDQTPVDDTPSGGASIQSAVQTQLGLKLEPAKGPIDFLVIDHVDKMPTEN